MKATIVLLILFAVLVYAVMRRTTSASEETDRPPGAGAPTSAGQWPGGDGPGGD